MQVSVWELGGVAGTVEMKGLRKKGMPEGMRRHGETEMPGSCRRAWGKGGPLVVQVDLEGKEGSLLSFSAKSVIFLSL